MENKIIVLTIEKKALLDLFKECRDLYSNLNEYNLPPEIQLNLNKFATGLGYVFKDLDTEDFIEINNNGGNKNGWNESRRKIS